MAKEAASSESKKAAAAVDLTMHKDIVAKLAEYRKERAFNAEKWVAAKTAMFNQYMAKHGLKAAVVSLSGGVDSAVTLGLAKRASTADSSPIKRVLGVAQPIHSSGWALERAKEAAKKLEAELIVVDGSDIHDALVAKIDGAVGIKGKPFATGNLRSYQRTPVGYYVTQLLSQDGTPALVLGTGNMDEDGYLAYFSRAGDGVVDVQLIADLHKSEVFSVGAVLGVPDSILKAAPSADLWAGQTDEEELGFTYDFIELFVGKYLKLSEAEQGAFRKSMSPAGVEQFDQWAEKARGVHRRNKHKLESPINLNLDVASL